MYDACVPWPERPKGAKDKSRGSKGLELEGGARRAPKLLVFIYFRIFVYLFFVFVFLYLFICLCSVCILCGAVLPPVLAARRARTLGCLAQAGALTTEKHHKLIFKNRKKHHKLIFKNRKNTTN